MTVRTKLLIAILLVSLLPTSAFAGSLTFGGATGDKVSCASSASIDNFTTFTVSMWVKVDTSTAARHFAAKQSGAGGVGMRLRSGTASEGGAANITLVRARATTATRYWTANTPLSTTGKWYYVVATYDENGGAGNEVHFYVGDATTPAVLQANDPLSVDGSGATTSDSGDNLTFGNTSGTNSPIIGAIAYASYTDRVLTQVEVWKEQYTGRLYNAAARLLIGFAGFGNQKDYSGKGNTCTTTTALPTNDAPRVRFAF